jgi:hypothetical protein
MGDLLRRDRNRFIDSTVLALLVSPSHDDAGGGDDARRI